MKYTKQPTTVSQQIEVLRKRGLIIDDEQLAANSLHLISYFHLAGYWHPLESNHKNHIFRPGSLFSVALSYHAFDQELRLLLFKAFQRIEIATRSRIIYHFSMKHGAFWFLDESLASSKHLYQTNLARIRTELERSRDEFILEHFQKYDEPTFPPAWKTMEVVSFGTLSKLYRNMADNAVRKQVAHDFNIPQHEYLQSWLESLTIIRNVCAHHLRLWNSHYAVKPKVQSKFRQKWITNFAFPADRLYPQLCCIAYWLNAIDSNNTFAADIRQLLADYPVVRPAMMGFPVHWQEEPLWSM